MSTTELISKAMSAHNLRVTILKAYRVLDNARRSYYIKTEDVTNPTVLEAHLKTFTVLESRIRSEIRDMNVSNMKEKIETIKLIATPYINS